MRLTLKICSSFADVLKILKPTFQDAAIIKGLYALTMHLTVFELSLILIKAWINTHSLPLRYTIFKSTFICNSVNISGFTLN